VPPPRTGSAWRLLVRQLGNDTQRIELEAYRDGFKGWIYYAHLNQITPIADRTSGPLGAFGYRQQNQNPRPQIASQAAPSFGLLR
jgi:hypothetical protein